jgi:hypothetical protein
MTAAGESFFFSLLRLVSAAAAEAARYFDFARHGVKLG